MLFFFFAVHTTFGNEKLYYEKLIEENIRALHLFPYHLADIVAKGLRLTPFNYYIGECAV